MSNRWTPAQLPDLTGRTAVVTGANSGVGLHTSLELARRGAYVVLACRDAGRGEQAVAEVRRQAPAAEVELGLLDLASLASVRTFAGQLLGSHPRLDILVNNAGVMALPTRQVTADGFEMQIATNHLGHFALTGLLLPALLAAHARVVSVSSNAHQAGALNLADLHGERRYNPWTAYAQSKLANLLFTIELQRRADQAAVELTSAAAHPGLSATQLVLSGPGAGRGLFGTVIDAGNRLVAQSAEMGSWPILYAAAMPDVRGAEYFGPRGLGGWRGAPVRITARATAYDPGAAAALWQHSAELTGVHYEALSPTH
jgi:NAD(P)-dependent dehydrogenase (short-subunit alcohol dehydrogenase family)